MFEIKIHCEVAALILALLSMTALAWLPFPFFDVIKWFIVLLYTGLYTGPYSGPYTCPVYDDDADDDDT